jgi:hypothetical protein
MFGFLQEDLIVVVVMGLKAHQLLRLFAPVHCLNYKNLVLRLKI